MSSTRQSETRSTKVSGWNGKQPRRSFLSRKCAFFSSFLFLLIALAVVSLVICRSEDSHRSNPLTLLFLLLTLSLARSRTHPTIPTTNQCSSITLSIIGSCQSSGNLAILWQCQYWHPSNIQTVGERRRVVNCRSEKASIKSDWIVLIWASPRWNFILELYPTDITNRPTLQTTSPGSGFNVCTSPTCVLLVDRPAWERPIAFLFSRSYQWSTTCLLPNKSWSSGRYL